MIERSIHVVGYSKCYSGAEKASTPAALMCYNNHVTGSRVILDVFRAKESSSTDCYCTVTSDTPTKLNFSTYNNHIPGTGCGSTLLFIVNGNNIAKSCYVDDFQLPTSNRSDTSVNIQTSGPQSVISTDYCILIESGSDVLLNLSCSGDSLQSLLTTSTVPTTEPLETSSIPTKDTSTLQSTSQTLPPSTEKMDTTSSFAVTTQSQSMASSTSQPITTTEKMETTSLTSLQNSTTAGGQTTSTLESMSVLPDTTEKATVETIVSSTERTETTAQMSSTRTTIDSTTIVSTESGVHDTTTAVASQSSTKSGAQDTTTIVTTQSSTKSGAQDTTSIDISQTSTDGGEQSTTTNATSHASITSEIQTTTTLESTQSSSTKSTQQETTSTALPPMTSQGFIVSTSEKSVTQKPTTIIPIVRTTFRQASEEVPWSGIIPAILLGVLLLAALLIAFIKWQRSREIKYPPNSFYSDSLDSSNKYPPMGETNFGYDAYEEDSGIVAEFSRSPEELEIEFADEGLDPKNLTKGPFIRYNVKDYSRNIESANYSSVRKQTPNGMDVYF